MISPQTVQVAGNPMLCMPVLGVQPIHLLCNGLSITKITSLGIGLSDTGLHHTTINMPIKCAYSQL